ncbi:MAG: hypothetical protein MZV70_46000 [Desulfobacterales bacterium]|nr:hypothetical protein [Desulfobacterales bacterium]
MSSQIDDLNSRITTTQAELEKYDKINREIEEIKKKLDNLNKKLAVIRELEANRYEPVRLMDTLVPGDHRKADVVHRAGRESRAWSTSAASPWTTKPWRTSWCAWRAAGCSRRSTSRR